MKVIKKRVHRILEDQSTYEIKAVFNDFHTLQMKGHCEYPLHRHDNYEVIIVHKGPYYCSLNSVELTVQSHQFLVVKPGDQHQDHLYDEQTHYVLHFSLKQDSHISSKTIDLLKNSIPAVKQIFPIQNDWNPASFFEDMEKNNRLKDKYSFKIQEPLMELFFWNMVRCIPESSLSESFIDVSNQQLFRNHLLNLFQMRFSRDLSVTEMSHEMNMSKRNLSLYCREYFKDSPARLFLKYKLKKSVELLESGTFTIKEISHLLGFDNPFHFSRVFKRVYKVSPSQYKTRDAASSKKRNSSQE